MNYIQLIFSPTGGTKKTADILMTEWTSSAQLIDLSDPNDDFSKYSFQPEDVVLIALPSYGGRIPAPAAERLSQIRGNSAQCILLCVYGNRAYEDTLAEMEDISKKCGFRMIAALSAIAEHSIMHQFASGRPDALDEQQLKSFARTILTKIKTVNSEPQFHLPGNRPYKKSSGISLVPTATKKCIGCGICAEQCPVQAISRQNAKNVDSKKCISCMRCVVQCPHSARKVNSLMTSMAALVMKKACMDRKECELFINNP